uniref:Heparan-sulfate 6-O-sulfotransferase n=1 Tax=Rodentolepis nana TaxID=102285 RepID=A0A0R3T480_RODNA
LSNNSSYFPFIKPYDYFYPESNLSVVLVFVHIQKTGGTFVESALTKSGVVGFPCRCLTRKVCNCNFKNNIWLFSRFSVGWRCGLHADFTELQECVPEMLGRLEHSKRSRRLVYFTLVRDSIDRYISEYLHMRRKQSFWNGSTLRCKGKSPPLHNITCDFANDVTNASKYLSFSRYVNCSHSLSNNRQTRMLASLADLDCYTHLNEWTQPIPSNISISSHQVDLLLSAVDNLATKMATFGIIEHSVYTQYMYRMILGLIFRVPFVNKSNDSWTAEAYKIPGYLPENWESLSEDRNRLDKAFISFARVLFSRRLAARLRAESSLPVRWRLQLRRIDSNLLISDVYLESVMSRYLTRLLQTETKRRLRLENTHSLSPIPPS